MKMIELTFPSGTYLLVEYENEPLHRKTGNWNLKTSSGSWKIVGKLSDLKEEDYAEIVSAAFNGMYRTYGLAIDGRGRVGMENWQCSSAKESFESAVEAAGWYLENPYGEEPKYVITAYGVLPDGVNRFQRDRDSWQASQAKTFNPELTYLFKRI